MDQEERHEADDKRGEDEEDVGRVLGDGGNVAHAGRSGDVAGSAVRFVTDRHGAVENMLDRAQLEDGGEDGAVDGDDREARSQHGKHSDIGTEEDHQLAGEIGEAGDAHRGHGGEAEKDGEQRRALGEAAHFGKTVLAGAVGDFAAEPEEKRGGEGRDRP